MNRDKWRRRKLYFRILYHVMFRVSFRVAREGGNLTLFPGDSVELTVTFKLDA